LTPCFSKVEDGCVAIVSRFNGFHIIYKEYEMFKSKIIIIIVILLSVFICNLPAQDVIDVAVKGISNNSRDGAQKDRQEAIMDAKRQACEKAGVRIESKTTVENFQTVYDHIESQAAAVLLPGFQIIDNGYGEDGTYSVVLVGKIRTSISESKSSAEFTLIIWIADTPDQTQAWDYYMDKLYEWLDMVHGKITIDEKPLDSFEDTLLKIFIADTLLGLNRRAFAFIYHFPVGDFVYQQRTKNTDGSESVYDFKTKMRAGKKYAMDAAHYNAIYFNKPRKFDDTVTNKRLFGRYPDNFKIIYHKP